MADFILDYIETSIELLLIMTPLVLILGCTLFIYEKGVEGSPKLFTKWSNFCDSLFGE